jgi:hypothetical protein
MNQVLASNGLRPTITSALAYANDAAVQPEFDAMSRAVAAGTDTTWATRGELVFWRVWQGGPVSTADARRYLAQLDQLARETGNLVYGAYACLTAVRIGEPDARARLRRADSLANLISGADQAGSSFLTLARCHEAMGDRRGALAMLARRALDPVYGPGYLSGFLYDEGRLALLEGDRPRALRAWRQFLLLRDAPEPALRPQVEAIRRAVDSLSGN